MSKTVFRRLPLSTTSPLCFLFLKPGTVISIHRPHRVVSLYWAINEYIWRKWILFLTLILGEKVNDSKDIRYSLLETGSCHSLVYSVSWVNHLLSNGFNICQVRTVSCWNRQLCVYSFFLFLGVCFLSKWADCSASLFISEMNGIIAATWVVSYVQKDHCYVILLW